MKKLYAMLIIAILVFVSCVSVIVASFAMTKSFLQSFITMTVCGIALGKVTRILIESYKEIKKVRLEIKNRSSNVEGN